MQQSINYRQVGGRILADYDKLPFGKTARLIGADALGPVFDLELPEFVDGAALQTAFVTRGADGILYAIDYSTGAATALITAPEDPSIGITLTQLSATQAIFFLQSTDGHSIWTTDGTVAGTRVLSKPAEAQADQPVAVKVYGELVAVTTYQSLFLLDPRDGTIQVIPIVMPGELPQPPLAVVGDRLYLSAARRRDGLPQPHLRRYLGW